MPASLGFNIRLVPIVLYKGGCSYVCDMVAAPISRRAVILKTLWTGSVAVKLVVDDVHFALRGSAKTIWTDASARLSGLGNDAWAFRLNGLGYKTS
jgi:hypothetical protein